MAKKSGKKTGKKPARKITAAKAARLDVVIPCRNEDPGMMSKTIESLRRMALGRIRVVVVFDHCVPFECGEDLAVALQDDVKSGTGFSRHYGIDITAGNAPCVFTIDGHMNFSKGYDDVILRGLKAHPKAVLCGRMAGADSSLDPAKNGADIYTGCRFREMSEEPNQYRFVMAAKWAAQEIGEIGCCMGACYAFRRDWYAAMGAPWATSRGWGCDEELISAGSWLMGGSVRLAGYTVGHMFRKKPPYEDPRSETLHIINRARYAALLPLPPMERITYDAWIQSMPIMASDQLRDAIAQDQARPDVQRLRRVWAAGDWSRVEPWIDRGIEGLDEAMQKQQQRLASWSRPLISAVQPVATAGDPLAIRSGPDPEPDPAARIPRVHVRERVKCPNCGKMDSFSTEKTMRMPDHVRRYGHCNDKACCWPGVKITRNDVEVMRWGADSVIID